MTKQTFLQGTFILIIAGFITRLLGFINRIVVARIIGEEGVGLYMMAIPTFVLAVTLTQFGLPVAISKLVAEASASRNQKKVKQILIVSLLVTGSLSLLFMVCLIVLAPILSKNLLTDARTFYPIIAIGPILPIIAFSSVIRGYFQGKQNMRPSAVSSVIEQVVRIAVVMVFTKALLPLGVEYAAAGAMASILLGELATLLYMLLLFKHKKSFTLRKNFFIHIKRGGKTFKDLMDVALPTTGSRLIGSISYFFEPIVVSQSLAIAGVTTAIATRQYGELTGYALPLLMLPTFISYALSVSLVPAISEANVKKQFSLIEYRLQQTIRLALLTGGIAVVILFVFSQPIMSLMYRAPHVAPYVQLMAPFCILLYIQGPLQAALQALNLAKAAMMNSFIGAVVKLVMIFALATKPELGIMGAALGIITGIVLVTVLHFATIIKAISFTLYAKDYLYNGVIMIISGYFGHYCFTTLIHYDSLLVQTLLSIFYTTLVYMTLAILFKLIKRREMKRLLFFIKSFVS